MSYQDTIDYLYSRLPMFSRIGAAAIKNDLDTIEKLSSNWMQKAVGIMSWV